MEIKLAERAGTCHGINRALEMASEAIRQSIISGNPIYMLEMMTHNPQTVKEFQERGVILVHSVDDISENTGTVLLRAHGVTPETIAAVQGKGLTAVDTTCTNVLKTYGIVADLNESGHTIVVVGEREHPEVVGIMARAGSRAIVVQTPDDLPESFENDDLVGVVSQTTQTAEAFDAIITALKARGITPEIHNTRCDATRERQEAAIKLAKTVDIMIVIGGHESSNTNALAKLCSESCNTHHIESLDELDSDWFAGVESVGITAGASTPPEQVDVVQRRIEEIAENQAA
ncbi:4-hydroxy-3-methylbut-2-enyl diphosphate reductase [Candidatus Saccharibacteria bacterium]|nr:4-hydroxy-3-methylbut-2-enyl diphosphate reductase [Candidatus Saccharibacteria bacterium]